MSTSTEGRPPNVPAWPTEARSLVRWVSTTNPFYVVSAGLFLVGLWLTFGEPTKVEDNWFLLAGLTAYMFLLAVTAVLLTRFAKVWDDARTVLLLIVLMFLASSVTLDYLIVFDKRFGDPDLPPVNAIASTMLALLVVVTLSETILRVIGLRLPILYRAPFYLILAIFICYPLAMTPFLNPANPRNRGIMWGLFGFSSIVGLAFLTLLPAIRRGGEYLRDNGSPWPWPLYPWSLFGLLAIAVPGRAILLCYSMLLIDVADLYDMTFGPYFLVPFGLCLCVLMLEAGFVTGRRSLTAGALLTPLALVAMSMVGHRPERVYQEFMNMFVDQFGADPVFMSLVAAAVFYTYAAIRQAPFAVEALTVSLTLATFLNPRALDGAILAGPQPAPMLVASILLVGLGAWRRGSWRCFAGACGLAVAFGLLIADDSALFPYRWPIAFHILLFAMLLIGWLFDDDVGKALRTAAPCMVLLVCVALFVLPMRPLADLPAWAPRVYPIGMAVIIAAYGYLLWHPPSMVIAGFVLLTWSAASGWHIYRWLRSLVPGLDYLVLSVLVFVLAILVSLGKSHLTSRWRAPKPEEPGPTE